MKKTTVAIIVFGLVLCFTVGGALAWLIDTTPSVTNTFTYGDIEIDLTETSRPYEMVPGKVLSKDPKITVKADSEPCWLFVQVNESANLGEFIEYEIAGGWEELDTVAGVYYRKVDAQHGSSDVLRPRRQLIQYVGAFRRLELERGRGAREARGGKRGFERA